MSQVVELAIEKLLEERAPAAETIVTSRSRFQGKFSREETYGGR